MADSDHEEADTRIVLHVNHALQRGTNKILIRTVDTDVIVTLIGQFKNNNGIWDWKFFCYYCINTICRNLG